MSAPTFRYAQEADLPEIVRIYNSTIASRVVTADLTPITVESRLAWFAAHQPEHHPLWVIEDADHRMLGWVSLSAFYGRPAYNATAEISVYLDEAARGKGLGNVAVAHAEAACPQLGIKTLLGFIFAHNTPSLKLFEKLGYQRWAHLPDVAELDGIERSLDILGKRLIP